MRRLFPDTPRRTFRRTHILQTSLCGTSSTTDIYFRPCRQGRKLHSRKRTPTEIHHGSKVKYILLNYKLFLLLIKQTRHTSHTSRLHKPDYQHNKRNTKNYSILHGDTPQYKIPKRSRLPDRKTNDRRPSMQYAYPHITKGLCQNAKF